MTADRDLALAAQHVVRWVTELVGVDFPGPDGRSTVTDHELIAATRALAEDSRSVLGAGPTGDDVEHAVRTLLGLIGGDPEAYRDAIDPDDVLNT